MFKDAGLRFFLQVLIDSGDEVPHGFTQKANITACTNSTVNNK